MAALQQLLTDQLRDLYDAEKQLTKALPKMAKAASDAELKDGLSKHLEVTVGQVGRLEQAFEALGEKAKGKPCKGMKGLVEEGNEHMGEHPKGSERDCSLIGAAVRVEHYEIAGYTAARATAKIGGHKAVVQLLGETLKEEEFAGRQLMQIADRIQKALAQGESAKPAPAAAKKSAGNGVPQKRASSSKQAAGDAGSKTTTDREEIRQWAEARGAKPSHVKTTGKKGDAGLLRLDFPGYSGGGSLESIEWEEWFDKFDQQGLALLYQETTAAGEQSNFNKIVTRETAAESSGKASKSTTKATDKNTAKQGSKSKKS